MIALFSLAATIAGAPADTTRPIAFIGANVIPMTDDRVLSDQTVVIEHGRIVAIGSRRSVAIPRNARRVDARGRFLLPGLTDAHVHLGGDPAQWMLPLFVVHGVTTVFNLLGSPEHLLLRGKVRSGTLVGPAIYTSGPYTNEPDVKSPDDAWREVKRQKLAGYDFVKIHGDLSRETHAALTAAGRAFHIPVIGHAPRNLPFESVLEAHQVMVAHGEELIYTHFMTRDTSGLKAMAHKLVDGGVWLTPNLAMFHGIATQWGRATGADAMLQRPEREYLNAWGSRRWTTENRYTGRDPADASRVEKNYRLLVQLTGAFAREGVRLLAGTDTPLPLMYPGYSLHDELEELVGLGSVDMMRS